MEVDLEKSYNGMIFVVSAVQFKDNYETEENEGLDLEELPHRLEDDVDSMQVEYSN